MHLKWPFLLRLSLCKCVRLDLVHFSTSFEEKIKNFGSKNGTLLQSFVILLVTETIFGMSGCLPVAQGQEIKE
jgi:hypothetical protein